MVAMAEDERNRPAPCTSGSIENPQAQGRRYMHDYTVKTLDIHVSVCLDRYKLVLQYYAQAVILAGRF